MKRKTSLWTAAAGLASAAGAAVVTYVAAVRPWHQRWGATDEEVARSMPGDEMVPLANFHSTRAITIDAPPESVWPWLVQIGQGRGGFYSYDLLENVMDLDIHSATQVIPEFQDLQAGDTIPLEPGGSGYQVAATEPNRLLLLYTDGHTPGVMGQVFAEADAASTWAFLLEERAGRKTRMIVRWRARWPLDRSVANFFMGAILDPVEFLMEQKMMRGIKERAESELNPG